MEVRIGTSGWSYDEWKGLFYPADWPKSRWFEYYIQHFNTVEINATFYRFFKDQTYIKWYEKAPEGFKYALKAPRLITHRKVLLGVEDLIDAFSASANLLGDKLGPILLQLAPSTPCDLDRLHKALIAFPERQTVAVEFRNERWLTDETYSLLERTGAVYCNVDSPNMHLDDRMTSETVYIRLHGHESMYGSDYSELQLQELASMVRRMSESGAKTFYIFFNNDIGGYAPKNAARLKQILGC